jgi:MFS family permease
MMYAILLVLGSVAVALMILLAATPADRPRAWRLRTSWALWALQPALLLGALLVSLMAMGANGYTSQNAPDDVDAWATFAIFGTVGIALLAGTVLGGLAWRAARLEQPPTSRRRWALAATLANALWFGVGAWLIGSMPVAVALDVVILVLAPALLLWPLRRPTDELGSSPEPEPSSGAVTSADEHLVG